MVALRISVCLLICLVVISAVPTKTKDRKKPAKMKLRIKALEKLVRIEIKRMKGQLDSCTCGGRNVAPNNSSGGYSTLYRVTALNSTMQLMYTELGDRLNTVVQSMNQYGVTLTTLSEYQVGLEERISAQMNASIEEMRIFTNKFAMDLSATLTGLLSLTGGGGEGMYTPEHPADSKK